MDLVDYSKSNPFEIPLRFMGEACHGLVTAFSSPIGLADAAFHATSAAIESEILPATLAVDALRTASGFMADGWHIGEHTQGAGIDMMGEIVGGLIGHAIGLSAGEILGASIGSLFAGPLGAISGAGIGGAVGSISAAVYGSYVGTNMGERFAEQSNIFPLRSQPHVPSYAI